MKGTEEAYLRRLDSELRGLPRARRRELLDEIREHITEAAPAGEAELRDVLDRLGEPEDIAAEARERFGVEPKRMGVREIAAVILLPIGGIVLPVIGWIIGVALLWGSTAWSQRDKWLGTLLFPGGLALPFLLIAGGVGSYTCYENDDGLVCPGEPSELMRMVYIAVLLLGTVGTIFTAAYLAQRARRGVY